MPHSSMPSMGPSNMNSYMNSKEISLDVIDEGTPTTMYASAQAQEELVDAVNQKLRVRSDATTQAQNQNEPAS